MQRSQTEKWIEIPFWPNSHHMPPNPFGVQSVSALTCKGKSGGSSSRHIGTRWMYSTSPATANTLSREAAYTSKKKLFCW